MIKLRKLVQEMPHVDANGQTFDLSIEKYNVSDEEKRKYLRAFMNSGVFAYSKKKEKWVFISKNGAKIINIEVLPDDWEDYLQGEINL